VSIYPHLLSLLVDSGLCSVQCAVELCMNVCALVSMSAAKQAGLYTVDIISDKRKLAELPAPPGRTVAGAMTHLRITICEFKRSAWRAIAHNQRSQ
jgi:hypothetical protein